MIRREFFNRVKNALAMMKAGWKAAPGDWMEQESPSGIPSSHPPWSRTLNAKGGYEDPDAILREIDQETPNYVGSFYDRLERGQAFVDKAWIFEAKFNRHGKMLRERDIARPFKIIPVVGTEAFLGKIKLSESSRSGLNESLREDAFDQDAQLFGPFDRNQYSEYAPMMGGPYFRQQYLYDFLKGVAYAFEAFHHNPLAHRIINGLAQYTLGRRFDWRIKDARKEKVWEDFAQTISLKQRLAKFWSRELFVCGELMINKRTWNSIDTSTVWEIVTDPDDVTDVYYYYRNYPTAYQQFTGISVPGAPGSRDVPSQRYIVEQLPYTQVIHVKRNVFSNEKRGRSELFSILGWLKRVKDLYNAQVIRAQMQASYIWDVTIDGGPGDVAAYAAQYASMPLPGSTHVHNKAVERVPMPVMANAGRGGGDQTSDNLLAFIATAVGLPKDFFNIIATGGGNRATALVAAEPFTKVVEDIQADFENLLLNIAGTVIPGYQEGDIEFIFPSVTKDTTSETVKNIMLGEAQGYIAKETAGTMYAQEMNITTYDFEDQQQHLKDETEKGLNQTGQPAPPSGRFGQDNGGEPGDGSVGDSPIHGQGRTDVADSLNRL